MSRRSLSIFFKASESTCSLLRSTAWSCQGTAFGSLTDLPQALSPCSHRLHQIASASELCQASIVSRRRNTYEYISQFSFNVASARWFARRPASRPAIRPPAGIHSHQERSPAVATPASLSQVEQALNHSKLVVTRAIEWGNVVLGYEQANKYEVLDESGQVVALMAEETHGISGTVMRQLLRTRRGFTISILSKDGEKILELSRSPFLITGSIDIKDGSGRVIGMVERKFDLFYRRYELFQVVEDGPDGPIQRQFASIKGQFLTWEFELQTADGRTLALIDRNFSGFGREIFTDAGKYVIHFGTAAAAAAEEAQQVLAARQPSAQLPEGATVPAPAALDTSAPVIVSSTGNQLAVARPLTLDERSIALACAISVDYDFFSVHSSHSGGWMPMPMFFPGWGGSSPAESDQTPSGSPAGGAAPGAEQASQAPSSDHTQSWMDNDEDDGDSSDGGGNFLGSLNTLWDTLNSDE